MKKICLLLILAMLFSMTACRKVRPQQTTEPSTAPTTATTEATEEPTVPPTTVPETTAPTLVTVYIPKEATMYGPDDTVIATMTYVFEDGWAEKEEFTATCATEIPGQGKLDMNIAYGDKCVITDSFGINKTESYLDEQGRAIRQISMPTNNTSITKTETTFTYDDHDRVLTREIKTYYTGQTDPVVQNQTFTYTDTDTGSKGVYTENSSISYEMTYDKNYRLVANVTIVNGQELSRIENTYDEHGNAVSSIQYAQGQMVSETITAYTAVEVSEETAARLPQFVKDK